MSHFKQRLELFKIKPFRYYILSCTFAMFGNGLTYIVMTWALLKSAHQVEAIAVLMTCFWLPNIFLSPLAGVLVDKYSRKKLLLFCNSSRALLLLCFWLLYQDALPSYAIYGLSTLVGTVLALYIPAAMTLVREIVDPKVLLYANATVDMAYELGAVAGMGTSGLIIALTSVHTTFLINAICYLCAFLSLLPVELQHYQTPKEEKADFITDLISGFQYLRQQPELKLIYSIQMLFFVSYMTAPILLAPFAKSVLHSSVAEFGYIEGAMSVGAVIGGIISPYLCEKIGFMKIMFIESILCAASFYAFSHNHYLPSAILFYFFIGFSFSAWPLLITAAQDKTAFAFQGRVQSLFSSASGILILLFYMLLALVGDNFKIQSLYWLEVVLMILSIGMLLQFKRHNTAIVKE